MKRLNSRNKFIRKFGYLEHERLVFLIALSDGGILPFSYFGFKRSGQRYLPRITREQLDTMRGKRIVDSRLREVLHGGYSVTRETIPKGITLEP